MAQKGTKIGEKTVTLSRNEKSYNDNNVAVQYYAEDIEGLSESQPAFIKITHLKSGSNKDWSESFTRSMHDDAVRFSIPTSIVREHNIKPGQRFKFEFFDVQKEPEKSDDPTKLLDDSNVIDRVTINKDATMSDNCDSRLYSERAANYVEENDLKTVAYRNTTNGMMSIGLCHANYSVSAKEEKAISFPHKVRKAIDASPDDLIEICKPESHGIDDANTNGRLEEIHSMVSEMYDAYLESKNA